MVKVKVNTNETVVVGSNGFNHPMVKVKEEDMFLAHRYDFVSTTLW